MKRFVLLLALAALAACAQKDEPPQAQAEPHNEPAQAAPAAPAAEPAGEPSRAAALAPEAALAIGKLKAELLALLLHPHGKARDIGNQAIPSPDEHQPAMHVGAIARMGDP